MKLKLFITLLLLAVMPAFAQNTGVSGVVVDADSGQPIAGATVLLQQGSSAFTGPNGDFRISAAHTGDETLTVIAYGYKDIVTSVAIDSHSVTNLGTLKMAVDKSIATSTDMAVLDENQIEDEEGNDQSIGMLAGASDDVYYNAASYDFSVMRFRLRGYAQEYSQMYVNGVHLTDAIRGRFNYSSFGGMNQAFKSKAASIGLTPSNYTLGEIGGSTNVNTLASNYAPGFRGSVSYTNGAYTMRGMVTYSTGLKENGWAFTLSAVGRYSKEGITEGTFYNSAGLFLSLQKVFNANHSLGITLYGAPTRRGGSSATYEEAYDLAGTHMYNPNWGWPQHRRRPPLLTLFVIGTQLGQSRRPASGLLPLPAFVLQKQRGSVQPLHRALAQRRRHAPAQLGRTLSVELQRKETLCRRSQSELQRFYLHS